MFSSVMIIYFLILFYIINWTKNFWYFHWFLFFKYFFILMTTLTVNNIYNSLVFLNLIQNYSHIIEFACMYSINICYNNFNELSNFFWKMFNYKTKLFLEETSLDLGLFWWYFRIWKLDKGKSSIKNFWPALVLLFFLLMHFLIH